MGGVSETRGVGGGGQFHPSSPSEGLAPLKGTVKMFTLLSL